MGVMTSHPAAASPGTPGQPASPDGHHHGEYKVPGGKLVVADVEVTAGAL
jgi:lipoate---protein ligase